MNHLNYIYSLDINECKERYTGCHQGCKNTPGSYVCTCYDGFTRDESGKNCTGKSKIVIYCHLSGKFMTEFT